MSLISLREKLMTLQRSFIFGAPLLLAVVSAIALAQSAGQLPADVRADSLARLPYLQRQNLDEAGQQIFDQLPGRGANGLGGPLAFAAYNPGVAKALFDLHNAAVGGALNSHVRELAILVACRETNYNLEWNGHEPSAVRAGVDAKVIDAVRRKSALTGLPEQDAVIIRFGRQLYTDRKVDSATFAKVVEQLGQRGAMDLVAVMNTYAVSGFYAIAVDEHSPAGKPSLER
jgi:4-carboxymuconolactone decarboxylase